MKPLVHLVALSALVAMGWAMADLLAATDAGGPPASVWVLLGSFLIVFAALFAGAGWALPGVFGSIGIALYLSAERQPAEGEGVLRWLGIGFVGLAVLGVVGFALLSRVVAHQRARDAEIRRIGRRATATVVDVVDTGLTVNEQPRLRVTFAVVPDDGSEPYAVTDVRTWPRYAPPRRGDDHVAHYLADAPTELVLGDEVRPTISR